MNKAELAELVAKQTGLSKKAAKEAVDAMFSTITKTICDGEPVRITGFGTFEARPRKSSMRINPQTKQRIMVASKAVPAFRAGRELKEMVRKKLKVVEVGGSSPSSAANQASPGQASLDVHLRQPKAGEGVQSRRSLGRSLVRTLGPSS
jgi:DNA-binding protein HU-beta